MIKKNLKSNKLHPFLRRKKKLAVAVMILLVLHDGNNAIRLVQHTDVIVIRPVLRVVIVGRQVLRVVIVVQPALHVVTKKITEIVNVVPVLKIEGENCQTKGPGGTFNLIKTEAETPAINTTQKDGSALLLEKMNQGDEMNRNMK